MPQIEFTYSGRQHHIFSEEKDPARKKMLSEQINAAIKKADFKIEYGGTFGPCRRGPALCKISGKTYELKVFSLTDTGICAKKLLKLLEQSLCTAATDNQIIFEATGLAIVAAAVVLFTFFTNRKSTASAEASSGARLGSP
jgi:hypothetical protein